jgi:Putative auto-transporter adhesin, head GIN domain
MSIAPTPIHRGRGLGHLRPRLTAFAAVLLAAILIALLAYRIFNESSSPAGTGSGAAATQARSLAPFTGVELVGENNVIVHVGARQSVIVHADSNLLSRVTTQVRSGSLVIGTTPGNLNAKTPMFVSVSVPSVDTLMLTGDGNITVTGINSRRLTVGLPGSGIIHATGTTSRLDVTINGEGTALLGQLIARDAKAALGGDGSVTLAATHSLKASVSGSGTIVYNGNPPHVSTTVSGNGTITPG